MSEQKMREALELIASAEPRTWPADQRHTFRQYAQRLAREALAQPEPVGPTVEHSILAGKILTLMGRATDPSLEPGADRMRDRIADVIAAHEAKKNGGA